MKLIDGEIREIEQRMARRRHDVADTVRAAKARATRSLVSPAGLVAAGVLGFVATVALTRKRRAPVYARADKVKGGAAVSLAGMLMPVALALVRAQFGSPAAMAQFFLAKMRKPSHPGDRHVAPHVAPHVARSRAPDTVHPAR